MKQLSIIVPYRGRPEHLQHFVPHVRAYFARDKLDRDIPYRVLIIEQEDGLPFNRGALKNIGFTLAAGDCDYTCFHDIDYLPVWTDYTWAEVPTSIVWYGAEQRAVAPGRSLLVNIHNLDSFFGGAVLIPNDLFRKVNGYANDYWGWGFEDEDLKARFAAAAISLGRRKGTYLALDHDSEGLALNGAPTPIAIVNQQLFQARWAPGVAAIEDGISTLAFEVVERRRLPDPAPERQAPWESIKVRLKGRPSRLQEDAHRERAAAVAGRRSP